MISAKLYVQPRKNSFKSWHVYDYSCLIYLSSVLQRTFVGVDIFSVFQEVYLQTNDPRVSNIVKFSDAIGELKVEVWSHWLLIDSKNFLISFVLFCYLTIHLACKNHFSVQTILADKYVKYFCQKISDRRSAQMIIWMTLHIVKVAYRT